MARCVRRSGNQSAKMRTTFGPDKPKRTIATCRARLRLGRWLPCHCRAASRRLTHAEIPFASMADGCRRQSISSNDLGAGRTGAVFSIKGTGAGPEVVSHRFHFGRGHPAAIQLSTSLTRHRTSRPIVVRPGSIPASDSFQMFRAEHWSNRDVIDGVERWSDRALNSGQATARDMAKTSM